MLDGATLFTSDLLALEKVTEFAKDGTGLALRTGPRRDAQAVL
jgi:hypothetical protein